MASVIACLHLPWHLLISRDRMCSLTNIQARSCVGCLRYRRRLEEKTQELYADLDTLDASVHRKIADSQAEMSRKVDKDVSTKLKMMDQQLKVSSRQIYETDRVLHDKTLPKQNSANPHHTHRLQQRRRQSRSRHGATCRCASRCWRWVRKPWLYELSHLLLPMPRTYHGARSCFYQLLFSSR